MITIEQAKRNRPAVLCHFKEMAILEKALPVFKGYRAVEIVNNKVTYTTDAEYAKVLRFLNKPKIIHS